MEAGLPFSARIPPTAVSRLASSQARSALGEVALEAASLPESALSIVFSTSVLEHVDRPREVYVALAPAVRPRGNRLAPHRYA